MVIALICITFNQHNPLSGLAKGRQSLMLLKGCFEKGGPPLLMFYYSGFTAVV
jgi:hypothetical protein